MLEVKEYKEVYYSFDAIMAVVREHASIQMKCKGELIELKVDGQFQQFKGVTAKSEKK